MPCDAKRDGWRRGTDGGMSERHRPTDAGRVVVVPGHVVVRRGDQPLPMFAGKSKLGASGDRRSTCTGPFPSRRAPPTPLTSHAWASSILSLTEPDFRHQADKTTILLEPEDHKIQRNAVNERSDLRHCAQSFILLSLGRFGAFPSDRIIGTYAVEEQEAWCNDFWYVGSRSDLA